MTLKSKVWWILAAVVTVLLVLECLLMYVRWGLLGEQDGIWNNYCQGMNAIGEEWATARINTDLPTFVSNSCGSAEFKVEDRMLSVGGTNYYVSCSRERVPNAASQVNRLYTGSNGVVIAEGPTGTFLVIRRTATGWEPKPHRMKQ